jgi:hypothetical protein
LTHITTTTTTAINTITTAYAAITNTNTPYATSTTAGDCWKLTITPVGWFEGGVDVRKRGLAVSW